MKKSALVWLAFIALMQGARAKTCDVSASGLGFGNYLPASAANRDATGSVLITCNGNIRAELSLSIGNGTGASYSGGRKMTRSGGAGTLTYNLYANPPRTQVFGDGTDTSVTQQINGNKSFSQPVYGRIPGAQRTTLSGSYLDTVIITMRY
jgi:spore coat protein U-like protein